MSKLAQAMRLSIGTSLPVLLVAVSLHGMATHAADVAPIVRVPAPSQPAPSPAPSPVVEGPVTVIVPATPSPSPSPPPAPPSVTVINPNALPPMSFYASVAADELLAKVKASDAFSRVEKDLAGSPVQLRVTHSLQPTAGGQAAGLLSAIWAGSTLGLLPVVTNNNLVLTYEVRVNGKELARYDFERSFTRAINIWAEKNDPTYGLGAEGFEWVKSTVTEFTTKAAQDPNLLALAREYSFYFGKETP